MFFQMLNSQHHPTNETNAIKTKITIKFKHSNNPSSERNLRVGRLRSKFVSSFSLFIIQQHNSIISAHCHLVVVWCPCQTAYFCCTFLPTNSLCKIQEYKNRLISGHMTGMHQSANLLTGCHNYS